MASPNKANQQALRNLEGSSSEPKTLDRAVRHEMNLGLGEWPTALMLTDAGEVSKGKRRDLKRSAAFHSISLFILFVGVFIVFGSSQTRFNLSPFYSLPFRFFLCSMPRFSFWHVERSVAPSSHGCTEAEGSHLRRGRCQEKFLIPVSWLINIPSITRSKRTQHGNGNVAVGLVWNVRGLGWKCCCWLVLENVDLRTRIRRELFTVWPMLHEKMIRLWDRGRRTNNSRWSIIHR